MYNGVGYHKQNLKSIVCSQGTALRCYKFDLRTFYNPVSNVWSKNRREFEEPTMLFGTPDVPDSLKEENVSYKNKIYWFFFWTCGMVNKPFSQPFGQLLRVLFWGVIKVGHYVKSRL